MSRDIQTNILVPIVSTGIPDNFSYEDFPQFIEALTKFLAVQIPQSITNVYVGPNQPSETKRFNVWYKIDNAGDFLGIFMFTAGSWQQIFPTLFQAFTPEITSNGDLVINTTSFGETKYMKSGAKVDFFVQVNLTITSTTGNEFLIALPDDIESIGGASFTVNYDLGSGPRLGTGNFQGNNLLVVRKGDGSAFTTGSVSLGMSGFFEASS